ncbi:MAG: metallopeptidase family protein [Chloroflexi bacterium]|nr:MAG: metallopeptidase family protein [Chloroflexota bacterium]
MSVERDRFRRLVQRALRSLPREVRVALDNVAVVTEREPSADDLRSAGLDAHDDLLGLYIGTPLTQRSDYSMALPDRIVIYQGPLERQFRSAEIPGEIARTVLHELAHHFGTEDERLDALGMG